MRKEVYQAAITGTLTFNPLLTIFNGEVLKGGAFRMRAVGADPSGNIRRSREYILFPHGTCSLFLQWREAAIAEGVYGYACQLVKMKNRGGVSYWECFFPEGDNCLFRPEDVSRHFKIHVSRLRPDSPAAVLLCGVEGEPGQYIFLA